MRNEQGAMSMVQGRDCSIVVRTQLHELGIPYAEETIREVVSLLKEEASIEGDGTCRAISKMCGVTGCVVTPLTLGTAPLLLYLAMGKVDDPEYVSETRNLYRYIVNLVPQENSSRFDVIQDRGCGRKFYANCTVTGFELRIVGGKAIKLKLDIGGEHAPEPYPYQDMATTELTERFMGDGVSYRINDTDYQNIYGLVVSVKKGGGTKTEVRIKRVLNPYPYGFRTSSFAKQNSLNSSQPPSVAADLPELIEELTVTARLYRDRYEDRHDGMFRLTFSRLLLQADGAAVDTGGAVIGPLRYYCAGSIKAHVFTADGRTLG